MKSFSLLFLTMIALSITNVHAQDAAKGKTLYANCVSCHGDLGMGSAELKAPKLAGQFDWYILKQLSEIKSGVRKKADTTPYKSLSEQDMKDLAAYIVTL